MLRPVFKDVEEFTCSDLYLHSVGAPSGSKIWSACHEIAHMLIDKNISYGDSALNPIRIFSTTDATEQLKVRIDDNNPLNSPSVSLNTLAIFYKYIKI